MKNGHLSSSYRARDPRGMDVELDSAPAQIAFCCIGVRSYILSIHRLRSFVFIKPVFINYKGETFPAAEICMLGVSCFLAGGERSRFSPGVSSWHWSPVRGC